MSALLAALGGVLAWLGFAGVGFWPLALVGFVPLFAALERGARSSGWRVLGLSLLFGTVLWGAVCHWLVGTLRGFSGLPLDAEVAMLEGSTPYQTFGDWPGVLALAVLLWLQLRRRR